MADILERLFCLGGKPLLDLMAYCVYSVQPEPLFAFLVGEYRLAPTATKALALFDAFCVENAPARLAASDVLPPRNLRLPQAIASIRRQVQAAVAPPALDEEGRQQPPAPVRVPPAYLFDSLVAHLRGQSEGPLQVIARDYNPDLSPHENLPGGKISAAGRFFADKVWQPRLRPLLVQAGFWRVGTVGG